MAKMDLINLLFFILTIIADASIGAPYNPRSCPRDLIQDLSILWELQPNITISSIITAWLFMVCTEEEFISVTNGLVILAITLWSLAGLLVLVLYLKVALRLVYLILRRMAIIWMILHPIDRMRIGQGLVFRS